MTMISNVDHGDRVRALESGVSGLKNSMTQHRDAFDTKLVTSLCSVYHIYNLFHLKMFQNGMDSKLKALISNVDHGDRVAILESKFNNLAGLMTKQGHDFNVKLVSLNSLR